MITDSCETIMHSSKEVGTPPAGHVSVTTIDIRVTTESVIHVIQSKPSRRELLDQSKLTLQREYLVYCEPTDDKTTKNIYFSLKSRTPPFNRRFSRRQTSRALSSFDEAIKPVDIRQIKKEPKPSGQGQEGPRSGIQYASAVASLRISK
ncbi:hypothetical protein J6590_031731 [Homalodisca vitripennis]|nr:hypothetical protein J6590_031731 [Homalodisca vitripennis]